MSRFVKVALLVCGWFASMILAAGIGGVAGARIASAPKVFNSLSARNVFVVDKDEKARIMMGANEDGPMIHFLGESGDARIVIGVPKEGSTGLESPALLMFGNHKQPTVDISYVNDAESIELRNYQRDAAIKMTADNVGARAIVYDKNHDNFVALDPRPRQPAITVFDSDRNVTLEIPEGAAR